MNSLQEILRQRLTKQFDLPIDTTLQMCLDVAKKQAKQRQERNKMFTVVVELYGSNGATCYQKWVFDVETQEEIVEAMKEYDESSITDPTDHPKIKLVSTPSDNVLDAGGDAWEFVAIYQGNQEVKPIEKIVEIFS